MRSRRSVVDGQLRVLDDEDRNRARRDSSFSPSCSGSAAKIEGRGAVGFGFRNADGTTRRRTQASEVASSWPGTTVPHVVSFWLTHSLCIRALSECRQTRKSRGVSPGSCSQPQDDDLVPFCVALKRGSRRTSSGLADHGIAFLPLCCRLLCVSPRIFAEIHGRLVAADDAASHSSDDTRVGVAV